MLVKDNESLFQHPNFAIQKKKYIFTDNNLSESLNMPNSSLFPPREKEKKCRKKGRIIQTQNIPIMFHTFSINIILSYSNNVCLFVGGIILGNRHFPSFRPTIIHLEPHYQLCGIITALLITEKMYDLKERKKKKKMKLKKKSGISRSEKPIAATKMTHTQEEKKKGRYVLRNGQVVIFLCRLVGCLNAAAPVGGTHYYQLSPNVTVI